MKYEHRKEYDGFVTAIMREHVYVIPLAGNFAGPVQRDAEFAEACKYGAPGEYVV